MAEMDVGHFGDARLEKGARPWLDVLPNAKRFAC